MALDDFKGLVATSATISSSIVLLTGIAVCNAFLKSGTTGDATSVTFVSRKSDNWIVSLSGNYASMYL